MNNRTKDLLIAIGILIAVYFLVDKLGKQDRRIKSTATQIQGSIR